MNATKTFFHLLAIGLMAACFTGCEAKKTTTPPTGGAPDTGDDTPTTTPPDGGTPAAAPGTATLNGKVTLKGTPPTMDPMSGVAGKPECDDQHDTIPMAETVVTGPGGTLANVFVYVSKGVQGSYPMPEEPAVFGQKKCIYTPRVLGVRAKQQVLIKNDDPTLHNVHILPTTGVREINRPQQKGTAPIKTKFMRAKLGVTVKCDVHPWMIAYACVVDNPFFAVTGINGAFTLPEKLPAGTYTLTAWHEEYGTADKEVTLGDGETKAVDFEFQAK